MAENLGFIRLDRYLTHVPKALKGPLVLCGSEAVSLEIDGSGHWLAGGMVLPDEAWMRKVEEHGHVLVMYARPAKSMPDLLAEDLRIILSSGRAYGALVPAVLMPREVGRGRYRFLSIDSQLPPEPASSVALIDSNVLLDLEAVLLSKLPDESEVSRHVRALVMQLIHIDVIPGLALKELCWDRGESRWRSDRHHELTAVMGAWFGGGAVQASSVEAARMAHRALLKVDARKEAPHDSSAHPLQLAFYACLLKIGTLWAAARGRFRAVQRIELFQEFLSWLQNDLGTILSLAVQVAYDRLVGSQGPGVAYVDKLLKFGRHPLKELWGAAWDMTHLVSVDMAVGEPELFETGGHPVCLVTADGALAELRKKVQPAVIIDSGHRRLSLNYVNRGVDRRLSEFESRIHQSENLIYDFAAGRTVDMLQVLDLRRLKSLIDKLEEDFLKAGT